MPPKISWVACFCPRCKGAHRPKSTRDGHYSQERRRASMKISVKVKDKWHTLRAIKDASGSHEGVGRAGEARPLEMNADTLEKNIELERAPSVGGIPVISGQRPPTPASIPTAATQPAWAFVSPHVSQGPPCRSSAPDVASALAVSELLSSPDCLIRLNTAVGLLPSVPPNEHAISEQDDDPIGVDDWEDFDGDLEASEEPVGASLPASRAAPDTSQVGTVQSPGHVSNSESCLSIPGIVPAVPQGSTIPLNVEALAEINEPDPFYLDHSSAALQARWTSLSFAHPAVVLVMLLVSWLHLIAHLPYRFCDTTLTIIGFILAEVGQGHLVPHLRTSLTGSLAVLGLEPSFRSFPTCPACLEPHPDTINASIDTCCLRCGVPLFKFDSTPPSGRSRRQGERRRVKARLQTPAKAITEQLADILSQPGMEDAMEGWQRRPRFARWLCDFFDGAISKALLGPDGLAFFRRDVQEDPDGELRIGLALGVDWFSYIRSLISPSYTSAPMSFSIVNLPPYLRYRASNLMLSMIIPGPKETDPDQTQRYIRVLVNELIRLWQHGAVLSTYKNARGRRVRVILVGIFCDKPAAHKMGGFGSHAHTFFCTRDWITQGLKSTLAAFIKGGFTERTDAHHRRMMSEYRACTSKSARDDYAKAFATRWSEFARLPYFDMCRMIVVDPMHNLFLGVVKTHFYHIWVQLKIFRKTKEIRLLHEILEQMALPSKLGRLPRLIGEPAGGSLTADQWLNLATVVGPMALPKLWEGVVVPDDPDFLEKRRASVQSIAAKRKAQQAAKRKRVRAVVSSKAKGQQTTTASVRRSDRVRRPTEKVQDLVLEADDAGAREDGDDNDWADEDEDDTTQAPQLHPRDLTNFLTLCRALKHFLTDKIHEDELALADKLIREYCTELIELYGPEVIRPNHHYATHTAEFVLDYGPLREFWTFLFERLNKVLKSYHTNNHDGGEIENTFFREFHRAARLHRTLTHGWLEPSGTRLSAACRLMMDATSDNRGTLQQLAQDLDEQYVDDNVSLSLSPRFSREPLPTALYFEFLAWMNARCPDHAFHSDIAITDNPLSRRLGNLASVFDYAVIGGHRYHAATRSASNVDSIALCRTSSAGSTWIGEIQRVVLFEDVTSGVRELFAHMLWFRQAEISLHDTPWGLCQGSFSLQVWAVAHHLDALLEPSPNSLVALRDVLAPVACHTIELQGSQYWLTMPLTRAPVVGSSG